MPETRIYFYCRKVSRWQLDACRHFRCRRASWHPPIQLGKD